MCLIRGGPDPWVNISVTSTPAGLRAKIYLLLTMISTRRDDAGFLPNPAFRIRFTDVELTVHRIDGPGGLPVPNGGDAELEVGLKRLGTANRNPTR
jgi:hypothetical protein